MEPYSRVAACDLMRIINYLNSLINRTLTVAIVQFECPLIVSYLIYEDERHDDVIESNGIIERIISTG